MEPFYLFPSKQITATCPIPSNAQFSKRQKAVIIDTWGIKQIHSKNMEVDKMLHIMKKTWKNRIIPLLLTVFTLVTIITPAFGQEILLHEETKAFL